MPSSAATTEDFGINVGEQVAERLELRADYMLAAPGNSSALGNAQCNIGRTEQKMRLVMGAALVGAAAFAPIGRGWRIGLAALGVAELVTGTMRYCPVSQLLGVNTCGRDER